MLRMYAFDEGLRTRLKRPAISWFLLMLLCKCVCMYVCTVYAYQDQFGSCHDEAVSPFNITLYISTVALDTLYDSDQE